jgi:hypothetical protein
MHNLMLVAIVVVVGGAVIVMTDQAHTTVLRSQGVVLAIAGFVGLVAALLVLQRFGDLVPDNAEEVLSPAVAIGITAVLAVIGWRRHARRL